MLLNKQRSIPREAVLVSIQQNLCSGSEHTLGNIPIECWGHFSGRAVRANLDARVIDLFARGSAADWLQVSRADLAARMTRDQVAGAKAG